MSGAAETARRVHDRFSVRNLGRISLKNLSSPVPVWEVDGEGPRARPVERHEKSGEPPGLLPGTPARRLR